MSLVTSCDITRRHAIGSGSGSGAGGIRCHSTEGVAEERRGGGSGSGGQTGVGSGSGRRAGVGSVRGSPYRRWIGPSCVCTIDELAKVTNDGRDMSNDIFGIGR